MTVMLTVPEAAQRLRLSQAKVRALIGEGALGHHRFGRAVRVAEDDLEDFLKRTRVRATTTPRRP